MTCSTLISPPRTSPTRRRSRKQSTVAASSGTFGLCSGSGTLTLSPSRILNGAFAAIRDGKTAVDVKTGKRGRARVRGGEGAAKMAIIILGIVFNWAIRARMMTENPCRHVKVGSFGIRETILDGASDYARLFQTLDRMEAELRIRRTVADAIRVIALTGCRRGEIAGLRWSYVDLKQGRLVFPPSAHKTGRKTGKARVVGLPTAAQAIIARQPFTTADSFVFAPARGEGGAIELSHAWTKVRAEANLPEAIGLHGLRHSLASHMAMNGAQASEIMTALGHRQLSTAQKYIHWAEESPPSSCRKGRDRCACWHGGGVQAHGQSGEAERRTPMTADFSDPDVILVRRELRKLFEQYPEAFEFHMNCIQRSKEDGWRLAIPADGRQGRQAPASR